MSSSSIEHAHLERAGGRRPYGSEVGLGELFGTDDAARRYASARPPVHPEVVRLAERLGLPDQVEVALDVGCGAGLSTLPILGRARRCLAVDPAPAMVRHVAEVAAGALGLVARAEALPLPAASVDLVTAAGSLDFVDDPDGAVDEISRVLAPAGMVLVYDFTTGRRLRRGPDLGPWFGEVLHRWPRPPRSARPVDRRVLERAGLVVEHHAFEVDVALSCRAYVDYLLTESFLVAAVGRGEDRVDLERWLTSTVPWPPGDDEAEVVFEGYLLVARPR